IILTAINAGSVGANTVSTDALADGNLGLDVRSYGVLCNSSTANANTADRARNNVDTSLLASAARTTTTNSSDQTNYNGRSLALFVNVSSAGTGSITPSIQVKDSISGDYMTVWTAAAALTVNGDYT